jgi:hypothetical protein
MILTPLAILTTLQRLAVNSKTVFVLRYQFQPEKTSHEAHTLGIKNNYVYGFDCLTTHIFGGKQKQFIQPLTIITQQLDINTTTPTHSSALQLSKFFHIPFNDKCRKDDMGCLVHSIVSDSISPVLVMWQFGMLHDMLKAFKTNPPLYPPGRTDVLWEVDTTVGTLVEHILKCADETEIGNGFGTDSYILGATDSDVRLIHHDAANTSRTTNMMLAGIFGVLGTSFIMMVGFITYITGRGSKVHSKFVEKMNIGNTKGLNPFESLVEIDEGLLSDSCSSSGLDEDFLGQNWLVD